MIDAQVQLTAGDVLEFHQHLMKRRWRFHAVMLAVILVIWLWIAAPKYWLVIFPVALTAAVLASQPYRAARSHHRKQPEIQLQTRYTFHAGGVRTQNERSTVESTWAGVHEVAETSNLVLLFTSAWTAHIVPKRCLPPGVNAEALRNLRSQGRQSPATSPSVSVAPDAAFRLTVTTDKRDLVAASRTLTFRQGRALVIWMAFLLVVMAIGPVSKLVRGDFPSLAEMVPCVLFAAVCATIYFSPAMSVNALVKKDPSRLKPMLYEFGPRGMDAQGETGHTHRDWPLLPELIETRNLFLLYENKICAHVIPKRSFTSPQEMAAWKAYVQQQVRAARG